MVEWQFILSYLSTTLILPENEQPKDFASVNSSIKRDFKKHGLTYRFTDSDLKLAFVGSGRDLLQEAWNNEGVDAEVTLTVNKRPNQFAAWVEVFRGEAIMSNRVLTQDYFEVDFEELSLLTKIQGRKEVNYNTKKMVNLDGGAITNTLDSMNYDSKVIKLQASFGLQFAIIFDFERTGNVNSGTTTSQSPFLLIESTGNFLQDIAAVEEGSLVLNSTDLTESWVQRVLSDATLRLYDDIMDNAELFSIYPVPTLENYFAPDDAFLEGFDEISFSDGTNSALLDGEPKNTNDGTKLDFITDGTNSTYFLSFESGFELKREPAIGTYQVEIEVNVRFDTASESARYALVEYDVDRNGNETVSKINFGAFVLPGDGEIEQNDVYTITVERNSDKKLLFGFCPVSNTGGSFSGNVITFPLQNVTPEEISGTPGVYLKATWLSEYPETTIPGQFIHEAIDKSLEYITGEQNLLYSEVFGRTEIGYDEDGIFSKFFESNGYNIRNFDRGIESTFKNRLDSLNAIFSIGHGLQKRDYDKNVYEYRVEEAEYFYRNELLLEIEDIEKDSYRENYYSGLDFNQVKIGYSNYPDQDELPNTQQDINSEYAYFLPFLNLIPGREGDTAETGVDSLPLISDYIASDYFWEITRRKQFSNKPTEKWKLDKDLFIVQIGYGDQQLKTEESVEDVTGTGFDESAILLSTFNWLINPKYNLFNHSRIINSSLFRKPLSETIRNTEINLNDDASFKQIKPTGIGDQDLSTARALSDDFTISQYNDGLRLFDPVSISFRTGLTTEQANRIVEAHRNGLSSGNYGYFSLINPDGVEVSGWLLDLKFNPVDEIGSFILIKRNVGYLG